MWTLTRISGKSVAPDHGSRADRLMLYDQYGAMAYGVISQIISQPDLAQAVLIDLFSCQQLETLPDSPAHAACAIVRIARQKALETKQMELLPSTGSEFYPNDNLPELVFNLSFRKGYSLDAIADRLEMTYSDVLKTIRQYVRLLRIR